MGKKIIEMTIEYCDARPDEQPHCWHRSTYTYTSYPAQWDETCCHCGEMKRVHESIGGSTNYKSEHGPHYKTETIYNG